MKQHRWRMLLLLGWTVLCSFERNLFRKRNTSGYVLYVSGRKRICSSCDFFWYISSTVLGLDLPLLWVRWPVLPLAVALRHAAVVEVLAQRDGVLPRRAEEVANLRDRRAGRRPQPLRHLFCARRLAARSRPVVQFGE